MRHERANEEELRADRSGQDATEPRGSANRDHSGPALTGHGARIGMRRTAQRRLLEEIHRRGRVQEHRVDVEVERERPHRHRVTCVDRRGRDVGVDTSVDRSRARVHSGVDTSVDRSGGAFPASVRKTCTVVGTRRRVAVDVTRVATIEFANAYRTSSTCCVTRIGARIDRGGACVRRRRNGARRAVSNETRPDVARAEKISRAGAIRVLARDRQAEVDVRIAGCALGGLRRRDAAVDRGGRRAAVDLRHGAGVDGGGRGAGIAEDGGAGVARDGRDLGVSPEVTASGDEGGNEGEDDGEDVLHGGSLSFLRLSSMLARVN